MEHDGAPRLRRMEETADLAEIEADQEKMEVVAPVETGEAGSGAGRQRRTPRNEGRSSAGIEDDGWFRPSPMDGGTRR